MMRALAAIALVVVALVGWWMSQSHGEPVTPGPAVEGNVDTRTDPAAVQTAIERHPVPDAHDGPELDVEVVAFGTLKPLERAVVRYLPPDYDWAQASEALREDRTLSVRAVGYGGLPAPHVTVRLTRAGSDPEQTDRWDLGQTDETGRLVVVHSQVLARGQSTAPAKILAVLPGGESDVVAVDLVSPPLEVLLTLPATGSVAVHLLETDGKRVDPRYLEAEEIRLVGYGGQSADGTAKPPTLDNDEFTARLDQTCTARFERVALNRQFLAKLDRATGRARFEGPTSAGQHVAVETRPPVRSDRRGVEFAPRTLIAGVLDLGDVTVRPHHVVVAGRLVAGDGTDPPPVSIRLDRGLGGRWRQEYNARPTFGAKGTFEIRGIIPEGLPLRLQLRDVRFLPVEPIECVSGTTDVEIALNIAGEVRAVFLIDDQVPYQCLVYQLRSTERDERRDVRARIGEGISGYDVRPDDESRVSRTWAGLQPGTYRLSVVCPGIDEPIAVVDELVVRGGPCSDARLAAIDLRGLVQTIDVRALDADGRPVRDAEAYVVLGSNGASARGYHLGRGIASILTTGAINLLIVAPGHRIAEVSDVSDDRTVQLERAPELVLNVVVPTALPDGVELYVRLRPRFANRRALISTDNGRETGLSNFLEETVRIDTFGTGRIAVRRAAEYRVLAAVALPAGSRSSGAPRS